MNEIVHHFTVMTYDIDFAGVVSNIVYIRWLEDLRNLLAAQVLSIGAAFERGIAPTLMRTEIDYLVPVRFPEVVVGGMWLAERGRARWVLEAEFTSQSLGVVTARAKQTGVFVSLKTLRPVPLPPEFKEWGV
jgi:acyl-CoA thioester hydrolase